MSKYQCEHDDYDLESLKKYGYCLYFEKLVDPDDFPRMQNGYCSEECKTKMKEIYKMVMEQFSTSKQRYFEDARIFEYESKEIKVDPIYYEDKLVLINFKVGILNGKPVRLCDLPEGTKCDYDANHLPDNCTRGDNYYEYSD
ncbi:hypothetical protein ACTFIY_006321 [Dictyostelium cf. discoideum]